MPESYPVRWDASNWGEQVGGQFKEALMRRQANQLAEAERARKAEQEQYERAEAEKDRERQKQSDAWELEKLNLEKQRIALEMKNRKFEMATKEAQLAQGAAGQTPVAQAPGADFASQPPPPGMSPDEAAYILPETQVPRTQFQIPGEATPSGQPISIPLKYQEQVAEEKEAAGLASGDLVRDAQGNVISERRAIAGENAAARAEQARESAAARAAQAAQHDATLRAIAETRPKPADKPPTGAEMNALGYYQRASESIKDAEALEGSIAKKGLIGQARLQYGPNLIQTEDEQQYRQAQRAFTEARLRKESGAAIPPAEYENDAKTYFFQPGDKPEVTKQKAERRRNVLESLRSGAGRAYSAYYGEEAPKASNAPAASSGVKILSIKPIK